MSCLWKQFPDEMLHQKTLAKKTQFFLVLGSRSQNFGNLAQKPKIQLIASLSSNNSLDLPKSFGPCNKCDYSCTKNKEEKTTFCLL